MTTKQQLAAMALVLAGCTARATVRAGAAVGVAEGEAAAKNSPCRGVGP